MVESMERLLVRALRVPPEPEPPAGSPGSLRVFRAAPGFLRYKQLQWLLRQLSLVAGFIAALAVTSRIFDAARWDAVELVENVSRARQLPGAAVLALRGSHELMSFLFVDGGLDALLIASFVLQAPLTFAMVELDYRFRWYTITDHSLRIREGVWRLREQTMTFSNVQNVAIRQGPLQRLLGIADLEVRTAGGGSETGKGPRAQSEDGNLHIARFAGVSTAAEIRDTIRARLDDPPPPAPAPARTTALQAAREVLEEARSLRLALGGRQIGERG